MSNKYKRKNDDYLPAPATPHKAPVPIGDDGLPTVKYDKYGNPVSTNKGKGKGIMLKEQFATASKGVVAPSPEEISKGLTRPYWSINDMPLEYIYNSIMEYFNSILEPVYKRLPVLDDNGNPTYTVDGMPIEYTALVNYAYKNVPTRYGLAQALGVNLTTLDNYCRIDVYNSNNNAEVDYTDYNSRDNGYQGNHQNTYRNMDNHLIALDSVTNDSALYKIYGDDIYYNDRLREELKRKTQKDVKLFLINRARQEIMKYHEQRLGLNENVTGSLFALLNSRDGWTNDHTVKVEFPDLLGKQKTVEELDVMVEYEEKDFNEKDTPLLAVKDFNFDDDDGEKD